MKSKIKQITLQDGKQLFYPSDDEVKKLNAEIESVVIEETMSKEEFDFWVAQSSALADMIIVGLGITHVDLKDYYTQNGDG